MRCARSGGQNHAVVFAVDDQHGRFRLVKQLGVAGVQAVPSHLVFSKGAKGVAHPRFVNQMTYFLSHLLSGYLPIVEEVGYIGSSGPCASYSAQARTSGCR